MSHFRRTQIYLEDEQMGRLKFEAGKAKLAVSELIRRAIDVFLKRNEENVDWDKDILTRAVGKVRFLSKDVSSKHDDYLYGRDEDR